MTKDCTQPLRIGNIRALNGCAGRLFGAATLHNHKNSANKSNRKAMNMNWSNQTANPIIFMISQNISIYLKEPKVKYKLHYGRCTGPLLGLPHGTTPAEVTTNKI